MASERLQKILAKAGVASRRSAETMIKDGRVRVNGRIVSELGAKANASRDRIDVDGKRVVAEKPVYYLMHKPRGVVTTLDDPEGRKTIKDLLESVPERVFPVGRLDFQTSGALLLTNDGEMAHALLHPTRKVPKIYAAKLGGMVDERGLTALREGVTLDDGETTAPALVQVARSDDKHTFLDITIHEGRNRQIHRMAEAIGRQVLRLTRISFAGLALESLRPGQMRPLLPSELNMLKEKYLNPKKAERFMGRAPRAPRPLETPVRPAARPARDAGRAPRPARDATRSAPRPARDATRSAPRPSRDASRSTRPAKDAARGTATRRGGKR